MMKCRRLFAALVAIMMVVSMLGVTAYAEENEGVYVLAYNSSADDFNGHRYSYFSPYRPNFKIENQDAQTTWSVMFNLYDTINKEAIPTYCTDLETGINDDATYRRINLEDSTYAGVGAGVLRAIVNKGFPNTTAAALGEAAGVEGLTVGEALAATQAAVWKIANGSERVDFIDFYRAYDPDWSETIDHYAECNEEIASGYAGEPEPFSIVVCDLNGLKQVNDTFGHKAGDKYIQSACKTICTTFKHSPVYRIGGDEFVAILRGGDYEIRTELMARLHSKNEEHRDCGDAVIAAGLADYRPGIDNTFASVFDRADAAMYEDKRVLKGG